MCVFCLILVFSACRVDFVDVQSVQPVSIHVESSNRFGDEIVIQTRRNLASPGFSFSKPKSKFN